MKRKANFANRSAKRSRQSPLVPTVVGALADAGVLPPNLRALLKQTLPIVLSSNKVDRHAYEAEVVNQAQKALTAVQAAIEQEHAAALGKQNTAIAPAEAAKRTSSKKAAEAHLEASKNKLENDKLMRKAAEKAVQDAEAALKAAQKEEKVADKELQHYVGKKASLSDALANEFVMVKDITSASPAGKKAVQKLLALGKEFGLDSTLLSTLPISCKKQPESRSEFEGMVFTNLQALLGGQIQALSQQVGAAEPVKAAKSAAAGSAQEALDQAKHALKNAERELEAAHTAQKEANKGVSKADHFLRHIWEDMRQACDAQDKLASDVQNFKVNVWSAFNALKEKEPEPEPVEEPAAVEYAAPAAEPAQAES